MVKIRCSKCGRVVIDTETKHCDIALLEEVDMRYFGGRNVMVISYSLVCRHCGKEWELDELKSKITEMYSKKLMKTKKMGKDRAVEIARGIACDVINLVFEKCEEVES